MRILVFGISLLLCAAPVYAQSVYDEQLGAGEIPVAKDFAKPGEDADKRDASGKKITADFGQLAGPASEGDLLVMSQPQRGNPFRVLLDRQSIAVKNDQVSYLVVLESDHGVRNYFREAIDCDDETVQVLSLGLSPDKLHAPRRAEWEPVTEQRSRLYRSVLMNDYLCSFGGARDEEKIAATLQTGGTIIPPSKQDEEAESLAPPLSTMN